MYIRKNVHYTNSGHTIVRKMFQKVMSSGYGIHDNFQKYSGHTILSGISAQKVQMIYAITCTVITDFKLYIIDSIFACSSSLLNTSRKVLNASFVLFTFFYKINLSIIARNFFMSGKCQVSFISCPEYVCLYVQIPDMKKFWISYLIIFWDIFRTYSPITISLSQIQKKFVLIELSYVLFSMGQCTV